jgi:hypothetical protein
MRANSESSRSDPNTITFTRVFHRKVLMIDDRLFTTERLGILQHHSLRPIRHIGIAHQSDS